MTLGRKSLSTLPSCVAYSHSTIVKSHMGIFNSEKLLANNNVSNRKKDLDSHLTSRSVCILLPRLVYIPELSLIPRQVPDFNEQTRVSNGFFNLPESSKHFKTDPSNKSCDFPIFFPCEPEQALIQRSLRGLSCRSGGGKELTALGLEGGKIVLIVQRIQHYSAHVNSQGNTLQMNKELLSRRTINFSRNHGAAAVKALLLGLQWKK